MGRGRAKAKQQKVARELKYYSPDTDLSALAKELHQSSKYSEDVEPDEEDTEDDELENNNLDDYEKWAGGR